MYNNTRVVSRVDTGARVDIPRVHSLYDLRSLHDHQDNSQEEDGPCLPPSYSIATGLDQLPPSYAETNNKQVRLGPYIMVIDKNEKQIQKFRR